MSAATVIIIINGPRPVRTVSHSAAMLGNALAELIREAVDPVEDAGAGNGDEAGEV